MAPPTSDQDTKLPNQLQTTPSQISTTDNPAIRPPTSPTATQPPAIPADILPLTKPASVPSMNTATLQSPSDPAALQPSRNPPTCQPLTHPTPLYPIPELRTHTKQSLLSPNAAESPNVHPLSDESTTAATKRIDQDLKTLTARLEAVREEGDLVRRLGLIEEERRIMQEISLLRRV
jgi:hypothetical protein